MSSSCSVSSCGAARDVRDRDPLRRQARDAADGASALLDHGEEIEERLLEAAVRDDAQAVGADELDIALLRVGGADRGVEGSFDHGAAVIRLEFLLEER